MNRERKGITLVALVITIIVLLILAGITIGLTIGQKGIIKRAQEAGKNYQESAKSEDEMLAKFSNEVENIVAGDSTIEEPKYTIVEGVPVPRGFKHTEGTKETGFVIQDISEGSTKGNEFVWVPCTEDGVDGSIKYDRYAFSKDGWANAQTKNEKTGRITRADQTAYFYTETKPSIEINSINEYGGFYIGRYEVGIEDGTLDLSGYDEDNYTSPNKEWTGWKTGKAVVQENTQVWNYITIDKAKKVAEGMYANSDVVISRLCSSYAWDTALKFIETKNTGYATNSEGDNYSGDLNHTGIGSTPKNNIYDMGGNVAEWTTEVYSNQSYPYAFRGGRYNVTAGDRPAGFRGDDGETTAYDIGGFRSTLFVGL